MHAVVEKRADIAVPLAEVEGSLVHAPVGVNLAPLALDLVVLEAALVVAVPLDRELAVAVLLPADVLAVVGEGLVGVSVTPSPLPLSRRGADLAVVALLEVLSLQAEPPPKRAPVLRLPPPKVPIFPPPLCWRPPGRGRPLVGLCRVSLSR